MPNNVEVLVKQNNLLLRSFKGRLLGTMPSADAQALRNTPGAGRKINSESTMPYEELEKKAELHKLRIIIAYPNQHAVVITPSIKYRACVTLLDNDRKVEYVCGMNTKYTIKKIIEEKDK